MAITFILGAGFSIPAGYPSGRSLNEKFFQNLENKILKFSSGEWAWDEHTEVESNNGRLNVDYLNISFLLSELVEAYQKEVYMPFDYEEFYDWIEKDYSPDLIINSCEKVNARLKSKYELPSTSKHLFKNPGINEYRRVIDSYNYLIADLLDKPYNKEKNQLSYSRFIDLVKKHDTVDIFSLNHDTLVESIFQSNNIEFSDGYTIKNSPIVDSQKKPIAYFNDIYDKQIRLYKLHGSVDYHIFRILNQKAGNIYQSTDEYLFFKTNEHLEKHTALKIDPDTKEVIQNLYPKTFPQFLTGKLKSRKIEKNLVFNKLFDHFSSTLKNTDEIIIIGYSYRDAHINKYIKKSSEINNCKIININPDIKFPFRRNYSNESIIEISDLQLL